MGRKKPLISITVEDDNSFDIEARESKSERSFKRHFLYAQVLARLPNDKFWNEFKTYYSIRSLDDFGSNCYDQLEAYAVVLRGRIDRAMEECIGTKSTRELKKLRRRIEPHLRRSSRLRFLLRTEEKRMEGMLRGIDETLRRLGEKPRDIITPGKIEDIPEDIICPFCGKENKDFTYGSLCSHCKELIGNPWREHTICPKCKVIINRKDIFEDKEAYELDSKNNLITCSCGNRFDWKKYRREPEAFTIKYCIACDNPYEPNKRNWKKQRVCQSCKMKGIDPFYLDYPDYQKKYRATKKK